MTVTAPARTFAALRADLAEALAAAPVPVLPNVLDAVPGPCLIIGWGDPWVEPGNAVAYAAHPAITIVAGRVEATAAATLIEDLVLFIAETVAALPLVVSRVEGQAISSFAGVEYLTARVILTIPLVLPRPTKGVRP